MAPRVLDVDLVLCPGGYDAASLVPDAHGCVAPPRNSHRYSSSSRLALRAGPCAIRHHNRPDPALVLRLCSKIAARSRKCRASATRTLFEGTTALRLHLGVMAEHIALLDFGSNAVRFVLARVVRSGFRTLDEARVRTRLAVGVRGALDQEAIDHSLRAATRFLRRVHAYEPRVMAVATASVRDAPNAAAFVKRLQALGTGELRILSGLDEARLGAEAALRQVPLRHGAVIDLGGGSLQWTTIRDSRLLHGLSLPLGAARMTRDFIRHDPPHARELSRLSEVARSQLAEALPGARPRGRLIALGGTARALARRQLREGGDRPKRRHAATISLPELVRLRKRLEPMTIAERKQLRGMRPWRADIVVAGALVLEQLMKESGYEELTVCSASVREGVLWREARRLRRSK